MLGVLVELWLIPLKHAKTSKRVRNNGILTIQSTFSRAKVKLLQKW